MNMLNRLPLTETGFPTLHKSIDGDDETHSSKPTEFTLFDFVSFVTGQANPNAVEISSSGEITLVFKGYSIESKYASFGHEASLRSQTGNEIG